MNISHRSIWNSALGAWVAVSETTRGRGKRSGGASVALAGGGVLALSLLLAPGDVFAQNYGARGASIWGGNAGAAGKNGGGAAGTIGSPNGGTSTGGGGGGGYSNIATTNITASLLGGAGGSDLTAAGGGGGGGDGVRINAASSVSISAAITGGSGGAGGGGGGAGAVLLGNNGLTTTSQISGGAGGVGSAGVGGGGGGAGVILDGAGQLTASAGITGGHGGNGTSLVTSGNAGVGVLMGGVGSVTTTAAGIIRGGDATGVGTGGAGISVQLGGSIVNAGTIRGGNSDGTVSAGISIQNGGVGSGNALPFFANTALTGKGGAGITGRDINITNSGTIAGGSAAGVQANAITFTAGNNSLELQAGYSFTGNVDATAGASSTLILGGNSNPATAFDVSKLVATASASDQYVGFNDFSKTGNSTWILTGATATATPWTVKAGTLAISSDSSLGASASRLTLDGGTLQTNASMTLGRAVTLGAGNGTLDTGANSLTVSGIISGTGGLTKIGAGNLILTGINTYNGVTTVNAGTLSVNGSIAGSAMTVNNGGILGGNGTVGNTTIASGGVLAPGNSIGLLTINGNVAFAAGSTYRVEVNAAGDNDRVNVTGTANLAGGKVDVQAGAGTYAAKTTYTILNATGGLIGTFASVTSNLAFLTPTLGYGANAVSLTLARNDVSFNDSKIAITPNQVAVSTALQGAATGASGDMATVQTTLTGLSAVQARAAYDSVGGSSLVGLRAAGASFAAGFGQQMQARLGAAQGGGGSGFASSFSNRPVLLASNDHVSDLMPSGTVSDSPQKFSLAGGAASSNLQPKNDPANGFWLRGNGGYQNTSSDSNASASKVRNSGLSAGFDTEVREGLRAGVALSGGTANLSTDNNASGKSRGSAVALYGSYASGPWNFSGSTSLAYGSNHMDRTVTVGAINRVASSNFDSRTLSAYGEATYSMPMNGWTLQPLAGLSLSRSKTDGFTETGAGALNLQVAGQTTTSTKSLLGAKAAFDTGSVRLEPRAIWAHEFGDINTPMTAQFQGAAMASPFQVSGVALKRDTLILGLGASGSIKKNIDLFADVQAEHNSRQNNAAVLVGLRARW